MKLLLLCSIFLFCLITAKAVKCYQHHPDGKLYEESKCPGEFCMKMVLKNKSGPMCGVASCSKIGDGKSEERDSVKLFPELLAILEVLIPGSAKSKKGMALPRQKATIHCCKGDLCNGEGGNKPLAGSLLSIAIATLFHLLI